MSVVQNIHCTMLTFRKFRTVGAITILTTSIITYIIVTIYYLHHSTTKPIRYIGEDTHPTMLLLLVSQPRSGSSFLSRIISKSFESIYFYEPLYQLDNKYGIDSNFATGDTRKIYDKVSSRYLKDIFNCDFKNRRVWGHLYKSPFKVFSTYTRNDKDCDEKLLRIKFGPKDSPKYQNHVIKHCMPFLNAHHLQRQCQKLNLMVKILEPRLPEGDISRLQSFVHPGVKHKVIYLVRDPRASFHSLLRTGWITKSFKDETFHKYIQLRCNKMYENVQNVFQDEKFVIVRYEDIVTLPERTLSKLSSFFNEKIIAKISKQLRKISCYVPILNNLNSRHEIKQKRFATRPPSLENQGTYSKIDFEHRHGYQCFAVNKWRYKASEEFVQYVEESCRSFMDRLGYKSAGNIERVRSMRHSLILPLQDVKI